MAVQISTRNGGLWWLAAGPALRRLVPVVGYLLLLALVGCAPRAFRVDNPVPRFTSPESLGAWSGRVGMGLHEHYAVELSNDILHSAPNTRRPEILREGSELTMGAALGLPGRLQLEVRVPEGVQLKYQPIGEPADSAKKGNFSTAFSLNYVSANGEEYTQEVELCLFIFIPIPCSGNESVGAGLTWSSSTWGGGAHLGYRAHDRILLHGSLLLTRTSYEGTHEFTDSRNAVISSIPFDGGISDRGVQLGVLFMPSAMDIHLTGGWMGVKSGSSSSRFLLGGVELRMDLGRFVEMVQRE